MIGAVHTCGNGLNCNPHVHLMTTRELVNVKNGEIIDPPFIPFASARVKWMDSALGMLVRKGYLTGEEAEDYSRQYPAGFHVHFKPIKGN